MKLQSQLGKRWIRLPKPLCPSKVYTVSVPALLQPNSLPPLSPLSCHLLTWESRVYAHSGSCKDDQCTSLKQCFCRHSDPRRTSCRHCPPSYPRQVPSTGVYPESTVSTCPPPSWHPHLPIMANVPIASDRNTSNPFHSWRAIFPTTPTHPTTPTYSIPCPNLKPTHPPIPHPPTHPPIHTDPDFQSHANGFCCDKISGETRQNGRSSFCPNSFHASVESWTLRPSLHASHADPLSQPFQDRAVEACFLPILTSPIPYKDRIQKGRDQTERCDQITKTQPFSNL